MKSMKLSHMSLAVGLLIGLLALWVGATPVGAGGDLVTGGWTMCWVNHNGQWYIVGATATPCDPCRGTSYAYCSGYPGCVGGGITVVLSGSPGHTPHPAGLTTCTGSCQGMYEGTCY
jgi:hypothetical protein